MAAAWVAGPVPHTLLPHSAARALGGRTALLCGWVADASPPEREGMASMTRQDGMSYLSGREAQQTPLSSQSIRAHLLLLHVVKGGGCVTFMMCCSIVCGRRNASPRRRDICPLPI